jgi:hypothetical protein
MNAHVYEMPYDDDEDKWIVYTDNDFLCYVDGDEFGDWISLWKSTLDIHIYFYTPLFGGCA